MKQVLLFSFSIFLFIGCAIWKSKPSYSGEISIKLSELPDGQVGPLQTYFGIEKVNRERNTISIEKSEFDQGVKTFVQTAILNPKINDFSFYLEQSRPRLRYWEHIVHQLPSFVNYGYRYDAYTEKTDEKGQLLAFLVYRLNRNSAYIVQLFEQSKETIYALIDKKTFDDYHLNEYTETLLKAYEHITQLSDYEQQMKRIQLAVKEDDLNEDVFGRTSNQFTIYEAILQEEILNKYKGSNGMVMNEFGEYTDVLWFHSFWVRRHQEGNSEAVYSILKEIKKHYRK